MAGKPRQDDVLVDLLAAGRSHADSARQSGVSERTVHRRLADPDFRQRVDARRQAMLESGSGRLAYLVSRSVDTLEQLTDPQQPASIRLSAAKSVIDSAIRLRELLSIETRLRTLEEQFRRPEQ